NESVSPNGTRFYQNPGTGSYGVPLQPFSSGESYPDSPVTNPTYISPQQGYPTPGFTPDVGYTSVTSNNWMGNAASGYGFAGRIRGALGRFAHGLVGQKLAITPNGSSWVRPVSGENWLGGGITGTDPVTGRPVYD